MKRTRKQATLKCPKCGHLIPLADVAAAMGAKGGSTIGPSKARTSEQARAAVKARWAKYKAEKDATKPEEPISQSYGKAK